MTKAGYEIGRDEQGLTRREQEVLAEMRTGVQFTDIAVRLRVSKQRVQQVVGSLVKKGFVVKTDEGAYAVVVRRG